MVEENRRRRNRQLVTRFCLAGMLLIIAFTAAGIVLAFSMHSGQVYASESLHKEYTSYEVKAGDSIWNLYENSGYTSRDEYVNEVIQMNHLSEDGEITTGMYIVLPVLR